VRRQPSAGSGSDRLCCRGNGDSRTEPATSGARLLFAESDTAFIEGDVMPVGDVIKKSRQVRLHVSLPEAIIEAIDDYRFATRKRNRSEAVRQLLKLGQTAPPPKR
jgi:hypothetical protein